MSWADAAELGDDKLPPIPISWFKNNETVKVWKEPDWTVVKKKTNTKPLYQLYIRAVVDGRAWLVDTHGKALTVSVGAKLTDYGSIDKIKK